MSVFKTCDKGHDLTAPDAYVYRGGGYRECRECARVAAPRRRRVGGFQ